MSKRLLIVGLAFLLMTQATRRVVAAAVPADQNQPPATTRPAEAQPQLPNHPGIVPRDPHTDRRLIDLTAYYTLALSEDATGRFGYTFATLPQGVQQVGATQYDLRGVVQVSSQQFVILGKNFPQAVKGIAVGLKCQTLKFLHAGRWIENDGTMIGRYVIHYANGQTREIPIIFGVDLRDWRPTHDPGAGANGPAAAWRGRDNGQDVLLFETAWTNPLPDVEISSIDLVSAMTDSAPLLVAVTGS